MEFFVMCNSHNFPYVSKCQPLLKNLFLQELNMEQNIIILLINWTQKRYFDTLIIL